MSDYYSSTDGNFRKKRFFLILYFISTLIYQCFAWGTGCMGSTRKFKKASVNKFADFFSRYLFLMDYQNTINKINKEIKKTKDEYSVLLKSENKIYLICESSTKNLLSKVEFDELPKIMNLYNTLPLLTKNFNEMLNSMEFMIFKRIQGMLVYVFYNKVQINYCIKFSNTNDTPDNVVNQQVKLCNILAKNLEHMIIDSITGSSGQRNQDSDHFEVAENVKMYIDDILADVWKKTQFISDHISNLVLLPLLEKFKIRIVELTDDNLLSRNLNSTSDIYSNINSIYNQKPEVFLILHSYFGENIDYLSSPLTSKALHELYTSYLFKNLIPEYPKYEGISGLLQERLESIMTHFVKYLINYEKEYRIYQRKKSGLIKLVTIFDVVISNICTKPITQNEKGYIKIPSSFNMKDFFRSFGIDICITHPSSYLEDKSDNIDELKSRECGLHEISTTEQHNTFKQSSNCHKLHSLQISERPKFYKLESDTIRLVYDEAIKNYYMAITSFESIHVSFKKSTKILQNQLDQLEFLNMVYSDILKHGYNEFLVPEFLYSRALLIYLEIENLNISGNSTKIHMKSVLKTIVNTEESIRVLEMVKESFSDLNVAIHSLKESIRNRTRCKGIKNLKVRMLPTKKKLKNNVYEPLFIIENSVNELESESLSAEVKIVEVEEKVSSLMGDLQTLKLPDNFDSNMKSYSNKLSQIMECSNPTGNYIMDLCETVLRQAPYTLDFIDNDVKHYKDLLASIMKNISDIKELMQKYELDWKEHMNLLSEIPKFCEKQASDIQDLDTKTRIILG
ncbi:hypothetical protein cand_032110 [Cryptosporidium andersoni]|uniref:BRO1 domain-containing protein n=1 Tax=Cryptosporidium andersoni TaxID=117008 RepID=A0A1J4MB90_9CRYT|nr:hypothetical protein cand_032110 [Cryptosporidium andersoni]